MQKLFPSSASKLDERAWNAFPYCKTELTNALLNDRFEITVESVYVPNDRGLIENALQLSGDTLKKREVQLLDVVNDQVDDQDFHTEYDPATYHSKMTGRGLFTKTWLVGWQSAAFVLALIGRLQGADNVLL